MLRKLLCWMGFHDIRSCIAKYDENGPEEGFACVHCNRYF